jgi:hypothetical protein
VPSGPETGGIHTARADPNRQIRSLVLCVDLVGPDGFGLLRLGASSIWSDPDGSRWIVWMIKRMIKRGRQLDQSTRIEHRMWRLVRYP